MKIKLSAYVTMTIALLFFLCTCATSKKAISQEMLFVPIPEYHSIPLQIANHSHFKTVVTQDFLSHEADATLSPNGTTLLHITLPENSKRDLFYKYYIPLTSTETVIIEDFSWKFTVDINAENSSFEIPEINSIPDTTDYYIFCNKSKNPISLVGQSGNAYKTISKKDILYPSESGAYSSSENSFVSFVPPSILSNSSKWTVPIAEKRTGFVYTYDYDGNTVRLTDKRPLTAFLEPTWDCAIPEGVSVCSLIQHSEFKALYVAGTETAQDVRGFPFLRSTAGKIMLTGDSGAGGAFVAYAPFGADGDVQFFDATVSDGGELVSVGQLSAEEPCGIIVRYTADGAVSDFVAAEETVALGALCRKSGSSFFTGGIASSGNIIVMSGSCGASTTYKKIATITLQVEEVADGITLCYCTAENCVLLAVNFSGQDGFSPSRLYKIAVNSGTTKEIDIQGKIGAVSSIILNKNGSIFLAGETAAGTQTAASIVAVRNDGNSCETQFISSESPSWISNAWLDADGSELVVCGMTTQGKKRVPFLRAFDTQHFQTVWEQSYSAPTFKGMNDAPFVLPCADYGFLVGMSALDADNHRQAPFKIVRVTSSGQITEQHKTIQLQGAFSSK